MPQDWRTVQMFLTEEAKPSDSMYVCEVQIDSDNVSKLRCSCPESKLKSKCKHTKYVKSKMDQNNGAYTIRVPDSVPEHEAKLALESAEAFREFIVKYAQTVVL